MKAIIFRVLDHFENSLTNYCVFDTCLISVSGPTSSLATPKHTLRVGAWNVRTMYETGKTAQVFKEMERYRLNILGLSEIRWTGSGKFTLGTGATLCYSGRLDGQHHEGVGIAMDRQSAKALLEWEPVSSRIVRARFHSKFENNCDTVLRPNRSSGRSRQGLVLPFAFKPS